MTNVPPGSEKFYLGNQIGAGSFGEVYQGKYNDSPVAIKFETVKSDEIPFLDTEHHIYQRLKGSPNIPDVYEYGGSDDHKFLVMDLLGKNLAELHTICCNKFSLKTVLMIIDQSISIIEMLHKIGYIYRDIKPNNFLIGRGSRGNELFLIDYGLAKRYRNDSGVHIEFSEDKLIVGTARYCSARALIGHEQSRRDDMEALGYLWIYLLKGKLPWMGLKISEIDAKHDKIHEIKESLAPEILCSGLPREFYRYFKRVKELEFEEEPPYAEFREMFRKLFIRYEFVYDYHFDWTGDPRVEPKIHVKPPREERPTVSERLYHVTPRERQMNYVRGSGGPRRLRRDSTAVMSIDGIRRPRMRQLERAESFDKFTRGIPSMQSLPRNLCLPSWNEDKPRTGAASPLVMKLDPLGMKMLDDIKSPMIEPKRRIIRAEVPSRSLASRRRLSHVCK